MDDKQSDPQSSDADEGAKRLVIHSRPIIGRGESSSEPEANEEDQPVEDKQPSSQSKRPKMVPINVKDESENNDADDPKKTEEKVEVKTEDAPKPKIEETKSEPSANVPKNDLAAVNTEDSSEVSEEKSDEETKKALEQAEQDEKRQKQLQELVDSKKYYVPINAVARKRSIKVSLGLTFLVLLLSLVLVDLMLDSGIILLVQKIPHTHFFSVKTDYTINDTVR